MGSSNKEGNSGTFVVKVVNTQNSAWQGTVVWVEEQKTQCFRSALELVKLMDEAMGTDGKSEDKE